MKTKTNRKWLGIALSFALITGSVPGFGTGNTSHAQEPEKKLIVYVAAQGESADGQTKVELPKTALQVEEGKTAKEVIRQALDTSGYKENYVITENDWGGSLDAIGGLTTPEDYSLYWTFNVNGISSDLGIGSYQVKNQDKISLIYGAFGSAKTECDCYIKNESDKPDEAAQTALLISAKAQRDLLAEKIYQTNLGNGTYIPGIEDTDSLYSVFSLVQSGFRADAFYDKVVQRVCAQLEAMEKLPEFYNEATGENISLNNYEANKYGIINYTKIALLLSSLGKDITTAGGMNLTKKITSKALYDAANPTTLSRDSLILFAMDASGAEWPTGEEYVTRAELINAILADVDNQLGTSITWGSYDSAAMVIQALAPYRTIQVQDVKQETVKSTIENVLAFLSEMQQNNGGYLGYGNTDNVWTLAQVMTTLGVMGINPITDSAFIRNRQTVIDASSAYINTTEKTVSDSLIGGENAYQPEQLLRGLTSCINAMTKASSIYDTTKPLYTTTNTQPKLLPEAAVSSIPSQKYTGEEIKPAITLTSAGVTLKDGEDYTVIYQNNINPGRAEVILTGKGEWILSLKTSFEITSTKAPKPQKATLSQPTIKKLNISGKKLTVTFSKVKNAKKYTVEIATDKAFKKNLQKKTITATQTTFKKLKVGKKYFVRVQAANGKAKSGWSKIKNRKLQ